MEAYAGNDMAAHIIESGYKLFEDTGPIRSITNVHNMAIIITDLAIYEAKPDSHTGFSVIRLTKLRPWTLA